MRVYENVNKHAIFLNGWKSYNIASHTKDGLEVLQNRLLCIHFRTYDMLSWQSKQGEHFPQTVGATSSNFYDSLMLNEKMQAVKQWQLDPGESYGKIKSDCGTESEWEWRGWPDSDLVLPCKLVTSVVDSVKEFWDQILLYKLRVLLVAQIQSCCLTLS